MNYNTSDLDQTKAASDEVEELQKIYIRAYAPVMLNK